MCSPHFSWIIPKDRFIPQRQRRIFPPRAFAAPQKKTNAFFHHPRNITSEINVEKEPPPQKKKFPTPYERSTSVDQTYPRVHPKTGLVLGVVLKLRYVKIESKLVDRNLLSTSEILQNSRKKGLSEVESWQPKDNGRALVDPVLKKL